MSDIRVLLVDDFEMARVMLRGALEDLGFKNLEEAENGSVALMKLQTAIAEGRPYELVFCDWNMPDMTGIELLHVCAEQADLKNLPIIMVTAQDERHHIVTALKAGAVDYIVKPISPAAFKKKVTHILDHLGKIPA
jgi:two-component system chemotaxis response regulator CheY